MDGQKTKMRVVCPVMVGKNADKTVWLRMGVAYENRDGSTNIYLNALPTNGKLQLRPWEEDDQRRDGGGASDGVPF